ncbi:MAG TPA: hypothetical protein VMH05_20535 [Bryobacteraceae bacterium]|nr:hypothetical protein [Bryobacteraceae bacterium]
MKRIPFLGIVTAFVIAALSAIAPTAQAQTPATVVCHGVYSASHRYPLDSTDPTGQKDTGHYRFCISNPTADQIMRGNDAGLSLQGMPLGPGVLDILSQENATFFYFATRDEYNAYVVQIGLSGYQTKTARCGNTHDSLIFGKKLISAVFDTCQYRSSTETSENPTEAIQHEAGHAFSVAVALKYSTKGPSESMGWLQLVNGDIALQDATWNAKPTQAQKDAYVCTIFGIDKLPSLLEIDLGTPTQPVCNANGQNSYPGNKPPSYILQHEFPYFFTNNGSPFYDEIWANELISAYSQPGGMEIMPSTRFAMSSTFDGRCGTPTYRYYFDKDAPPPQNSQIYVGCGATKPYPIPAQFR